MRKNGFVVMGHLLKLVTPLAHIMAFTITMGTLGFLAAIFIMVLGAMGFAHYGVYHHHGNARFPGCHLYYGAGCDGVSESS